MALAICSKCGEFIQTKDDVGGWGLYPQEVISEYTCGNCVDEIESDSGYEERIARAKAIIGGSCG